MLVSASNLARAIECPASGILPKGDPIPESPASKRGSISHAWCASKLRGWPLPDVGKHKVSHIDVEALRTYLGDGEMRNELAMAWDPVKRDTEIIGENIGRAYPEHAGIIGTADVAMIRPAAMVLDIKTGRQMGSVADNWQVRALSVMLAHAYDVDSVTGVLAYLNRDGSWTFDPVTWGAFALAEMSDELADWAKKYRVMGELAADGWWPQANPSLETCRYCDRQCSQRYGEVAA
jgi:hypothetical protein